MKLNALSLDDVTESQIIATSSTFAREWSCRCLLRTTLLVVGLSLMLPEATARKGNGAFAAFEASRVPGLAHCLKSVFGKLATHVAFGEIHSYIEDSMSISRALPQRASQRFSTKAQKVLLVKPIRGPSAL